MLSHSMWQNKINILPDEFHFVFQAHVISNMNKYQIENPPHQNLFWLHVKHLKLYMESNHHNHHLDFDYSTKQVKKNRAIKQTKQQPKKQSWRWRKSER